MTTKSTQEISKEATSPLSADIRLLGNLLGSDP